MNESQIKTVDLLLAAYIPSVHNLWVWVICCYIFKSFQMLLFVHVNYDDLNEHLQSKDSDLWFLSWLMRPTLTRNALREAMYVLEAFPLSINWAITIWESIIQQLFYALIRHGRNVTCHSYLAFNQERNYWGLICCGEDFGNRQFVLPLDLQYVKKTWKVFSCLSWLSLVASQSRIHGQIAEL